MSASKSMKIRRVGFAALLALAIGCNPATAGTSTGTLSVSASVVAVCILGNATLAFGTYNPTSATPLTATTTVTLTCSLGTPYNIGMGTGSGTGATTTLRVMTSGANTLGYKIFQNSADTTNWGNTVGTDTYTGTSSTSSLTNTINIYGQIPAGEAAAVGSYTDSVTMTVTF
jgi:spore coat protein U-like protein